ncbi:hypothetical protein ACWEF9_30790 [Streptomyces sp. NPDC004980]
MDAADNTWAVAPAGSVGDGHSGRYQASEGCYRARAIAGLRYLAAVSQDPGGVTMERHVLEQLLAGDDESYSPSAVLHDDHDLDQLGLLRATP